jgi:hypothetical protein
MTGDDMMQYLNALLGEGREELARVETKITTLFGVAGVVTAALLGGAIAGQWSPNSLDLALARWTCWAGFLVGGAGLIDLVLGFRPRIGKPMPGGFGTISHFGDVTTFVSKDAFAQAIRDSSASGVDRAIDQVWQVSHLVDLKYRYINRALVLFGLATVTSVLALVIEQLA